MRVFAENKEGEIPGQVRIWGKVGIEKRPEEYELDTEGKTRSIASYLVADRQKMKDEKPLESILEKLSKESVEPVRFTWDKNTVDNAPDGEQFGFDGLKLKAEFPELVRQTSQENKKSNTVAVAYQNMVPVLVKAIQELTEKVTQLETEITTLKNRNNVE